MQSQNLLLQICMKKISMTIVLVIFCWLNPYYQNQSVLAQTPDQNTSNSQKQENLIQEQILETQQPKIEENQTQQPENPEVKKETIDIGVSIGYNTFVVTALALLITILSIVLTISIFVLGFLGYSKIKDIDGIKTTLNTYIDEIKTTLNKDIDEIKTKLNRDEKQLEENITGVNVKLGELNEKINGQVSELQKIVSSERDKTEKLREMIDNISDNLKGQLDQVSDLQKIVSSEGDKTEKLREMINDLGDDFKKYIQAEAVKMNRLGMIDYCIQMKYFEQALKEIKDFEKTYFNEKELLKRCQINRATILCNQEYASIDYDQALKELKEMSNWPEYQRETYNLIAYCYSQKYYDLDCQETDLIKQAKEQLKQLEKIIAEENTREVFNLKINLGNCEIHLEKFQEALEYFNSAESFIDGINSINSPSEFYLWRAGKLICYLSCIDKCKTELNQEFQIFTSNIDEWNEGLKYCKKHFPHLDKYLKKLEEEFEKFKQGETT